MNLTAAGVVTESPIAVIQAHIESETERLLASLPDSAALSSVERRGIIARYASVLEGNFIYWMTGALLSVNSEEARAKIVENLREEVRDCHPGMMRRFALAADAVPTEADAAAVYQNLSAVRQFVGRMSPVPLVVTMGFFEGFIQRFMPYLADLARREGSSEMEYTDVHGVCDVTHTKELFEALEAELALSPRTIPDDELFAGIQLLSRLIRNIVAA